MQQACGVLRALTWVIVIIIALLVPRAPGATLEGTTSATQARVRNAYGKLSLSFEANQGQTDDQVQFLARSQGMSLFLTATETVLVLPSRPLPGRVPLSASPPTAPTVLRMHFVGSNPVPQVAGLEQLPGTSNYFLGNDPTQWRTHIPTFAKVTYREMYPGSAVLYYGTPHQLEYGLLVAPGADPSTITLAIAQEGGQSRPVRCLCTWTPTGRWCSPPRAAR